MQVHSQVGSTGFVIVSALRNLDVPQAQGQIGLNPSREQAFPPYKTTCQHYDCIIIPYNLPIMTSNRCMSNQFKRYSFFTRMTAIKPNMTHYR